ncbi:MAG: dephospho-CoA kinase [Deltaproteobacteria bacterium]|nr:dephospho-CoA kinase [Deltaproteobacteria bacterium]
MLTIAVTGGVGSGKTLVCECFRRLGAHAINLDDLAREVVQPGSPVLRAIVDHFGEGILRADGTLNRSKLRSLITENAQDRKVLEQFTHPEILRLLEAKVAAIESRQEDAVVVVEVPLLIEVGMQDQFGAVVLVEASVALQESRLMARDSSSAMDAQALIGIQMATEEKRPHADYIVENRGTIAETQAAVQNIYDEIRKST